MSLSTVPSGLQTLSNCVGVCNRVNHASSCDPNSALRASPSAVSHLRLFQLRPMKCRASGRSETDAGQAAEVVSNMSERKPGLISGSAIVVVEAPPMLKTAEPMPMMRANRGLIKAGDAGRIIDRRPKDVWAVRFAVGAYLIDGKYFKALD